MGEKWSSWPAITGATIDAAADKIPLLDVSEADSAKNKVILIGELATALGSDVDKAYVDAANAAQDVTIATKLGDAASDSKIYGRQNAAWVETVTKGYVDSELNGQDSIIAIKADIAYVDSENAAQDAVIATKLGDAASDSKIYGRQNAAWIEIPEGTSADVDKAYVDAANAAQDAIIATKIGDAAADSQIYGRSNNAWVEIPESTGGGSVVPGGATAQVQFNDAGAFAGDSGLTFDKTTNRLTALYVDETNRGGFSDGVNFKMEYVAPNVAIEFKDIAGVNLSTVRVSRMSANYSDLGYYGSFSNLIYFLTELYDLWPCINLSSNYSYGWSATTGNVPPDTALRRHATGIVSANGTTVTALDPESVELPGRANVREPLPDPQAITYQPQNGAFLGGRFILYEGVTAPAAIVGYTQMYTDVVGSVKIKLGDGTVKTLGADVDKAYVDAANAAQDTAIAAIPLWVEMTQAEYDALVTKDPNTLYVIVG